METGLAGWGGRIIRISNPARFGLPLSCGARRGGRSCPGLQQAHARSGLSPRYDSSEASTTLILDAICSCGLPDPPFFPLGQHRDRERKAASGDGIRAQGFPAKAIVLCTLSGQGSLLILISPLAKALSPNEKVFQDFPVMRGRKWLVANLTIDQSIYNFWHRTHSHRLVERLAVRTFKLIVEHANVLRRSSGCASAARYVHAEALQDAFDFGSTAGKGVTAHCRHSSTCRCQNPCLSIAGHSPDFTTHHTHSQPIADRTNIQKAF